MQNMGKVSVIVPVYKAEKYLKHCLDSIVNQTYKNLEIILVDDGSPDGSPAICDKYAVQDARIKVIHKKNEGIALTRNAGLDAVTGDYVVFVDSDDWIDENMVEFCVEKANNFSVNIVWFGRYDCTINGIINSSLPSNMTYDEIVEYYVFHDFGSSLCDKFCRRCVWDGLRFPKGLLFEDSYAVIVLLENNKEKILTVSDSFYYYRCDDPHDSIMEKIAFDPEEPYYRWVVMDKASGFFKRLHHSAYKLCLEKTIRYALKAYIVHLATHCLSDERLLTIEKFLKRHYCDRSMLNFEYRVYYYSWKHWDFINHIKALDFKWKYRLK